MDFYIFVLFLLFDFNQCGPANQVKQNNSSEEGLVEILEAPYKLDNDKKLYRVIRLSNGLTALLVSTQEYTLDSNETIEYAEFRQKKSACSLKVEVGSFSDPRDIQGLTHFIGMFDIFIFTLSVYSYSICIERT